MTDLMNQYRKEIVDFDRGVEIDGICESIRSIMRSKLRRRGLVVAVSGGIDSSVCAALSVRALGRDKVLLLQLPETDSSEATQSRGSLLVEHLKTEAIRQNIAPTLEAIGCYAERDSAIKQTFPEYAEGWKNKIAIRGGIDGRINHFFLIVSDPDGKIHERRLQLKEYLQIVAATNYKQRVRKTIEYYHADRLNYAVVGTPNRLEYDQGFFVKNGDGSADIKPIAHLYKTQVYALAEALGLPGEICNAIPTTDTYSLEQGQDEFFFALDYKRMDLALWAYNQGYDPDALSNALEIPETDARYIFDDIARKRSSTKYLHMEGLLASPVTQINTTTSK